MNGTPPSGWCSRTVASPGVGHTTASPATAAMPAFTTTCTGAAGDGAAPKHPQDAPEPAVWSNRAVNNENPRYTRPMSTPASRPPTASARPATTTSTSPSEPSQPELIRRARERPDPR